MTTNHIRYDYWDYIFLFWFFTNALFNHTMIGIIGQVVFMLYSVFKCVSYRKFSSTNVLYLYTLFVFICYLNIFLGNSVVPKESKFLLNVLLRNGIMLYCLYAYVRQLSVFKLSNVFVFACLLGSISMLIYNKSLTGSFIIRGSGDEGLNGNMMATLDAMAVCCIVAIYKWKSAKNILYISMLVLFCVFAGTRKAFLVLIFGLSIFIVLSHPKKIFSNVSKLVLLLCFLYFMLMKVPFIYDIIGNRFETLVSFVQGGDTDDSTRGRDIYIEYGYYYFLQKPWSGHGIHCFKEMPGVDTYSHNNYVELLFSVGIPGMIAFYLIHLYILLLAIRNRLYLKYKTSCNLAISLVLAVLFIEYAMVTYYERAALLYYVIILRFATVYLNPRITMNKQTFN